MTYLWLSLVIFADFIHNSQTKSTPNGMQIYGIMNDCIGEEYPIKIVNSSVKLENDLYKLRFDVAVQEDVNEDINFEMAVIRCLDKAAPDTCEEFHKYTFRHFCKMMKIPGPWLTYLRTMEPPYQCPMKKGLYIMKKSIFCSVKDMERMNFGHGYFFKIYMKTFGVDTNKLYSCCRAEGQN